MRQVDTLRRSALCSASFLGLAFAFATPAAAQATQPNTPPVCDPNDPTDVDCQPGQSEVEIESGTNNPSDSNSQSSGPDITVTGSRIRRPNVESNVPVTSVSAEDLTAQGDTSVGDALNDLPALRSTFSQANSTRFIGTVGLNLLDLRGLGTSRTLVLVNGRRHITASAGEFLVDVNTIPTDLIERVDVVTGGSSAVYGSDAVAGVVNFVLRRDFEGVRVRGQGGISEEGDRGIYFTSLTAGENFLDDRLNVAINLEYTHADQLRFPDRPDLTGAFSGRCQFNQQERTAGEPQSGDGFPDLGFFCGVRNANIAEGGLVSAPITIAGCQNPAITPANAALCLQPGTPNGAPRFFIFSPNGQLVQQNPSFDFRGVTGGASGNVIGGGGSTLRNTGQLAPEIDRYTANLLVNFELSPAFRPFLEAKYVHVSAIQEGQPSFFQGFFGGFFGGGTGIRCDNPFLTAQNIQALQSIGRCAAGPTSTQQIPLSRFNIDFGGRQQFVERDTYRVVAGLGGEFNGDWNYELSFNYGRFEESVDAANDLVIFQVDPATGQLRTDAAGNPLPGPFLNAIDAVRLANGTIVCRINADTDPTNNDPLCNPINVLGAGQPSVDALRYVNRTSNLSSSATQYNVLGFVSGDSSQLFEFPGGPARFVVGGEYRREEAFQQADPVSAAGATFFNAFQVFDPPPFEVIEGFGELEIPILRDVPFAEELTVTGAARYSDYNTAAGTTFAWNVNGTYAPFRSLRFRANYSKSVRVPTLGDLFTPDTQNFNFIADPCDTNRIGSGSPTRAANCAALGVPPGFVNTPANSQTTEIISSGNPFLEEEEGESLTIGAVFTPEFIPGLSFTVDYYKIEVDNLIATLSAQQIVNQCVDLPTIDNQFCQLIFPRQTDDPSTPDVNETGFFAQPALRSGGINFARLEAEGIDFELAYRRRFESGFRLDLRGILTYVIERNSFTSPTDPEFGNAIVRELGDPQLSANFTAVLGTGPFDLRYTMNYVGEQLNISAGFETFFPFQGRPAQNEDLVADEFRYYPDTFYHALRLSMRVSEQFQFYIGADNVFDTDPPLGILGNEGGAPYDNIGRYFYAGATIDF